MGRFSARPGQVVSASAWIVAGAVFVVLGLVPRLRLPPASDVAWPLYLAGQVLAGARHGVDFLEVNPPLFIWLAIPPVLIHEAAGITAWQANVLWVGVLSVVSLALSVAILRTLDTGRSHLPALVIGIGFCVFVLPRWEFGQREHLALLGVMPYFLLAAVRLNSTGVGRGLAIAAGIGAGLGFSLKPFFLVPWLVLEFLLGRRTAGGTLRRMELMVLAAAGAAYAAAVVVLAPDYLPMATRLGPLYTKLIGNPLLITLGMAGPVLLSVGAVLAAERVERWPPDALRSVVAAGYIGFLAAAVLQRKGFAYHFLPAWGFTYLFLLRSWQTQPPRPRLRPSGIILAGGAVLLLLGPAWLLFTAARELRSDPAAPEYNASYGLLLPEVRKHSTGGPFVVLFSNPAAGWPLAGEAGVPWASRYMSLWPLPALYHDALRADTPRIVRQRMPAERTGPERRFNEEVLEDLRRFRPEIIVVPVADSMIPASAVAQRFDYAAYFTADERFRAFLEDYPEVGRAGPFVIRVRSARARLTEREAARTADTPEGGRD